MSTIIDNKKILYISYDGMTDPLGQSQVISYLIGLTKYGYTFHILSFEKKDKWISTGKEIKSLLDKNGIKWFPNTFHSSPPIVSKVYDKFLLLQKAKNLHKKYQYDMVHCRSYTAAEAGLYLKRTTGIKFLFDMRGFWADEKADGNSWDRKKWFWNNVYKYYKKKEADFIKESDHIISLTFAGKSEISSWQFYNDKVPISVIPCCADQDHFKVTNVLKKQEARTKLGIDNTAVVLSYLGSLGAWYMVDEMLQFFKELQVEHPTAKFLIVTNSKHDIVLKKLSSLQLNSKDFILMTVPFSAVPDYMYACDISISFIKPVYSKISSSPVKIGEVLSMGIPIISNTIGDIGKLFLEENVGIPVKDFSSKTFSSAAKLVNECKIIDPKSIREVAVKHYNLQEGIAKYATAYEEIFLK